MDELDDLTLKQVSDSIINGFAKRKGISKTLARKLFINALRASWVIHDIDDQMCMLMGEEIE